jgi:hypothetical protein
MVVFIGWKSILCVALAIVLFVNSTAQGVESVFVASSYSIELEGFRWNTFPLKILVYMNQWSKPDYADAIHEAFDSWTISLRIYSDLYGDTTLTKITYAFYVSNIYSTADYDIVVTFNPDVIFPGSNTVGWTVTVWGEIGQEPFPPTVINITTQSATVSSLFVKNVAMHEFGHTLGLGHASSSNTTDGPEVMYHRSVTDKAVYPSTLDIYALTTIYQDNFSPSVELPSTIPYKMLRNYDAHPIILLWKFFASNYHVILIILLFELVLVLALVKVTKRQRS